MQESIHGCGGSRGGWVAGDILGGPQINRGGANESVEDALDADLFIYSGSNNSGVAAFQRWATCEGHAPGWSRRVYLRVFHETVML